MDGAAAHGNGQPRVRAHAVLLRLARNTGVHVCDAPRRRHGTRPRKGRVDERLERRRELRHAAACGAIVAAGTGVASSVGCVSGVSQSMRARLVVAASHGVINQSINHARRFSSDILRRVGRLGCSALERRRWGPIQFSSPAKDPNWGAPLPATSDGMSRGSACVRRHRPLLLRAELPSLPPRRPPPPQATPRPPHVRWSVPPGRSSDAGRLPQGDHNCPPSRSVGRSRS